MELGAMNLVQCFKCQKFGYKQTCCSLDVTNLNCVKERSDAICQRPVCNMNYTTLISVDCPSFCRGVQFTKSKLKRTCYSWRLKRSIATPVNLYPTNAPSPFKSAPDERTKTFKCPVHSCNVEA